MSVDLSRYVDKEKLGEGTYGVVFKATDKITNQAVALKIIKLEQEPDGIPPTTLREMSILKSLDHHNIIKLHGASIKGNNIVLVTECCDFDLRYLLTHSEHPLDVNLVRSYAFQLLCGIFVLHTHRIIHRDLKPENLLLTVDGALKICDFGLSRYFSLPLRQYSPGVVSQWYKAPELLIGDRFYELSIDIWAAGCIIAEMTNGRPLFQGDSDTQEIHKIFEILGTPTKEEFPNFGQLLESFHNYPRQDLATVLNTKDVYLIDLLNKIFNYNPIKRITAQEALHHPYFYQICPTIKQMCWPPNLPQ